MRRMWLRFIFKCPFGSNDRSELTATNFPPTIHNRPYGRRIPASWSQPRSFARCDTYNTRNTVLFTLWTKTIRRRLSINEDSEGCENDTVHTDFYWCYSDFCLLLFLDSQFSSHNCRVICRQCIDTSASSQPIHSPGVFLQSHERFFLTEQTAL